MIIGPLYPHRNCTKGVNRERRLKGGKSDQAKTFVFSGFTQTELQQKLTVWRGKVRESLYRPLTEPGKCPSSGMVTAQKRTKSGVPILIKKNRKQPVAPTP